MVHLLEGKSNQKLGFQHEDELFCALTSVVGIGWLVQMPQMVRFPKVKPFLVFELMQVRPIEPRNIIRETEIFSLESITIESK